MDLLGINPASQTVINNKSIITFLSKNFLCYNFSRTDFLILSILNNLIKETKISQQTYAADLFNITFNYFLNKKITSFYQIEKQDNLSNENNITSQSIKMNNINSANTSLQMGTNIHTKGNNHNNCNNNPKFTDSKLPYILSLVINIMSCFLQNITEDKITLTSKNFNNNNLINPLKSSIIANFNANNNNLLDIVKFNLMEGENLEAIYLFLEKILNFLQEILLSEKDLMSKLLKSNPSEFTENDFNEKIYKFFIKSEIMVANDILNFLQKIIFYKKADKLLKNKIVYFFFENLDKILFGNNCRNEDISENKNDRKIILEKLCKNLFLRDENYVISILVLAVESLSEQFNSKAEELFDDLNTVLLMCKIYFEFLTKNKDNILKTNQMSNIGFLIEKGNKLILVIEEKIRQKKKNDESFKNKKQI